MGAIGDEAGFDIDAFVRTHEDKSLLRFITCGSVDDGKSTLLGRLLFETQALFEDQLVALEADSRRHGTQGSELDLALLVDGLAAEREQGITIDVAYRYFTTHRRKFIVADTPGHEQYTRNMATGASTADLAVLLVDARKGATAQTRRHALIVASLGIRHVVVAVNKMDLIGWSQTEFARIVAEVRDFTARFGFESLVFIPLSALTGDNVVTPRAGCWHRGPTLLAHLEAIEPDHGAEGPFRMSVQWVNRPDSRFRGYAGLIAGGAVAVGDAVEVLPSRRRTRVDSILTYDGAIPRAVAGQTVTLTFTDEVDAARGDLLADPSSPPHVVERLRATTIWMSERPAVPGATFLVKIGARTVAATLEEIVSVTDLTTFDRAAARELRLNDIGEAVFRLERPVALDAYAENRDTGGFIVIDRESFDTLAVGMVIAPADEAAAARPEAAADGVFAAGDAERRRWLPLGRPAENSWRSIAKAVTWRITGSLDTVVLAYLFTRDARISVAIGLTEVATKFLLYYGHERIWARIPFGRRP